MVTTRDALTAVSTPAGRTGLRVGRFFTRPGVHPYDELEWDLRDAVIKDWRSGEVAFEQRDVEFPKAWSLNATNIVAQKYFRGHLGSPERERSVRQMIDRVADTITTWGVKDGYFTDDDSALAFNHELKHLLVNQKAAFNSPVWFNLGVPGRRPQASACFILSVDDTMSSILNWYVEEGTIFKGGSGAGVNLSRIRSSVEPLSGGGTASGPVSFMRGADASAGTIKSGGTTRRAAKMVILNVDHPDIQEFIWCKQREELKARALREAGFDMDLDGRDGGSIQYQNANNSVRVTDEFMQAVVEDRDFSLRGVLDGTPKKTVRARELMAQIAQAAWECADPGLQYDTTINDWHTTPNAGRINASNPCCFVAETQVETADGAVRFDVLEKAAVAGQPLPQVKCFDLRTARHVHRQVRRVWVAGTTDRLLQVVTQEGLELRCTPEHRFLTADGRYVAAQSLVTGQPLRAVTADGEDTVDAVASAHSIVLEAPVAVFDLEVDGTHNFAVTSSGTGPGHGVIVHNSEYMHLDNSACNLASLNLRKFEVDGAFDVEAFRHAVEIIFTAQEIIVGNASYPTEKIAANAKAYRQLGLGYANLGGLLMALGLPYDSDQGRAWAAAITALMTGQAYRTSAEIAKTAGPFEGFEADRDGMLRVIAKHHQALDRIDTSLAPSDVLDAARRAWADALDLGSRHGIRNAQATVLAPTGTTGLMLDCDTTGIEPDLGLVKSKKLVGGGTMRIVNRTVPVALRRLGYQPEQIEAIVAYIDEQGTIEEAPALRPEHLAVFDCAMGERSISPMGHVRMMAAVQPWISGALSKTVNVPESATVGDVEEIYLQAWRLGLKAIAIYRDNCKVAQPLSLAGKKDQAAATEEAATAHGMVRRRLPKQRPSQTISFQVGDAEGYLTAGEYPGDGLGEIFVKLGKQGSTLSGVMDAFAISVSLGLQYGVPLEAYVKKFTNMRFEPAGLTDDPEVRFASSIVDYIFRRLAIEYLPADRRQELGIYTLEERDAAQAAGHPSSGAAVAPPPTTGDQAHAALPVGTPRPVDDTYGDAPMCYACGVKMQPAGSCYVCSSCGSTSGCS
ncbi:MAG TPA: hypothetical protein VG452_05285 [Egibacteraceae bacterium]|nr:hypothetical protein [Egibacteraceae bacterium]